MRDEFNDLKTVLLHPTGLHYFALEEGCFQLVETPFVKTSTGIVWSCSETIPVCWLGCVPSLGWFPSRGCSSGPSDAKGMAMRIFVDKENGDSGVVTASKDRLRLLSAPSKTFVEKSHPKTPLVGRTANVNLANVTSQSVRKALGNLNRPLSVTKTQFSKGKKFSAKKATENTSKVEGCSMVTEACPEKENLFPCNPLDFESFEVPEEHRLSHMPLTGVPLMKFEKTSAQFTSLVPAPINQPLISWGYDNLSDTLQSTKDYLATLDDIIIDLPPPL